MQLFDLFQAEFAVHGGAHHGDAGILREDLRYQLPHQSGIIDHQNTDRSAQAVAPFVVPGTACGLPSRFTTALMLRMSTTVPSPRMEAPLTRSVATKWSSSALMTSSSSPTSLSTTNPNFRSPMAITMTNNFFALLDFTVLSLF